MAKARRYRNGSQHVKYLTNYMPGSVAASVSEVWALLILVGVLRVAQSPAPPIRTGGGWDWKNTYKALCIF